MAANARKVLCIQGMEQAGLGLLEARDDIEVEIVMEEPGTDLKAHLADVHAVTLRSTRYMRELIDATPNLEVASRFGVGFDSVDVPALTERGVPLMIAGTANSVSVAEHAMFMMLDLAKLARRYHAGVAAGNFGVRNEAWAVDLYRKQLLVVGFGRIGTRTVRRAVGFEMAVAVHDPYADPEAIRAAGAEPAPDLDAALARADFVTVHCPKNPETIGLIDGRRLGLLKPNAIIVNTARGGIIEEKALIEVLRGRRIAAAGLDVFDPEPPEPDNPLFAMDNVLLSPHSAGVTRESADRMAIATCQNVLDVFDGKPDPENVVNREVLGRGSLNAMRKNNVLEIWRAGGAVVNGWLSIPNGFSAEVMAGCGWDSVTIDLQHGVVDYSDALSMLQGVSLSDATPMARVPWLEPGIIQKLLDAGSYGIICPMINSREECERLVACCNYAPKGSRSFGPIRAVMYAGADYAAEANDTVLAIAMIETQRAIDNLDDILSTPGLDGIYVGPSDLSLSLGHAPQLDTEVPEVVAAIDAILAGAKRHNVPAGLHCGTPAYAARMFEKGFQLATIANDSRLMAGAASAAVAELKGMAGRGGEGSPY